MTHYSRHCLHLGCGEPLGNALARLNSAKKNKKPGKQSKQKHVKQADKNRT